MISRIINSLIIVILSYILLRLIQYLLCKLFKFTKFDTRYEDTLCSVLSSISYYIVFIVSVILILREFEVVDATKFGTLVTGASIIGIIAGVASQSILNDIFNGFFILFEKQLQVGDFVIINEEFRGSVEEIGLRSTSLRDWDLRRITISNGSINSIRNYSKKSMRAVVNIRVSYQEDPEKVIESLEEVCIIMNSIYENYMNYKIDVNGKFSVYGITDIEKISEGIQYTITGVIDSYKYFDALKDARLNILNTFRKNNIKVGYPTHINVVKNNDI